jgi:dihydrolipoamide dehydrogenase
VLLMLEADGAARPRHLRPPRSGARQGRGPRTGPSAAPVASTYAGKADLECDMLVLGAGPGGYSAAFRAADLGMKVVLSSATPRWAACA